MSRFSRRVSDSTSFEVPDEGAYHARCVALIFMGTYEDVYEGRSSTNKKLFLAWELLGTKDSKNAAPFVVSREFNWHISPTSNLGKFLAAWRGRAINPGEEIDLEKVLGSKCQLTVAHRKSTKNNKERTYIDVMSATPLVKGTTTPDSAYDPFAWAQGDGPFEAPDWLPRSFGRPVADVIADSMESRGFDTSNAPAPPAPVATGDGDAEATDDDGVPF